MFDKKVQTSLCFLHRARKPLFNTLVALTPKNIVNTSVGVMFVFIEVQNPASTHHMTLERAETRKSLIPVWAAPAIHPDAGGPT